MKLSVPPLPALVLLGGKRGESAAFVKYPDAGILLREESLECVGDLEVVVSWEGFRAVTFLLFQTSGSIGCASLGETLCCSWKRSDGVWDDNASREC
jgi:hypothetical protein